MVDPRGSGLLFFMFIRPHPYTCLGIGMVDPSGAASGPTLPLDYIRVHVFVYKARDPYTCLGIECTLNSKRSVHVLTRNCTLLAAGAGLC